MEASLRREDASLGSGIPPKQQIDFGAGHDVRSIYDPEGKWFEQLSGVGGKIWWKKTSWRTNLGDVVEVYPEVGTEKGVHMACVDVSDIPEGCLEAVHKVTCCDKTLGLVPVLWVPFGGSTKPMVCMRAKYFGERNPPTTDSGDDATTSGSDDFRSLKTAMDDDDLKLMAIPGCLVLTGKKQTACTVQLRNVPPRYSEEKCKQDMVSVAEIPAREIVGVHVPRKGKKSRQSYAFVTFESCESALKAIRTFHKYSWPQNPTATKERKECECSWAARQSANNRPPTCSRRRSEKDA